MDGMTTPVQADAVLHTGRPCTQHGNEKIERNCNRKQGVRHTQHVQSRLVESEVTCNTVSAKFSRSEGKGLCLRAACAREGLRANVPQLGEHCRDDVGIGVHFFTHLHLCVPVNAPARAVCFRYM